MACRICTFYSYRGGSGRTMTAANVAWILASNGRRVLAVDWDLEAPGLDRYFAPFLDGDLLMSSEGLIDLIEGYAMRAMAPAPDDDGWLEECADITRFAVSLDWDFPAKGSLDLVHAGRRDQRYASRVSLFDWRAFYERFKGGGFLELVKARMRAEYDDVIIDCGAGLGESAGICTVQMSDRLVACTTLDWRSVEGTAAVGSSVMRQRPDLEVFPLITRVDMNAEVEVTRRTVDAAWRALDAFLHHMPPERRDEYRATACVPYVPAYAFGEHLAVFDRTSVIRDALVDSAERLVAYLSDGEVTRTAPVAEETRDAVIAWAEDRQATAPPPPGQARPVLIFVSYSHFDKKYLKDHSLLGYLGGLKTNGAVEFWWDDEIVTGDKWDDQIKRRIRETDIALVLVSQWFLNSAYCRKVEIAGFLRECEERGLLIFPIIVSACDWKAHAWLRQRHYQPENDRNIEEHYTAPGKRKALFLDIYRDLKKQVERKRPTTRADA